MSVDASAKVCSGNFSGVFDMSESSGDIAVVGGGTMGVDVALVFAAGGWKVHIVVRSQARRDALPNRLQSGIRRMGVGAGVAGRVQAHAAMESLPWERIDLAIECVTEDLEVKRRVFSELEAGARPDAVLATNTSGFSLAQVGAGIRDVSRFVGIHFFMPAHLIPLVEIVRTEATKPGLPEKLGELMASLGKVPIQVRRDVEGFVANRLQHALLREAFALVESGVGTFEDIDAAVRFGFGFRFLAAGPFLQKELSGLDVLYKAAGNIWPSLCNAVTPSMALESRVRAGELGIKTRKGLFDWTEESAAAEKERFETVLDAALGVLESERKRAPARSDAATTADRTGVPL